MSVSCQCPKETGVKQGLSTGFQICTSLGLLMEPEGEGTKPRQLRTALLWGTASTKDKRIKSLRAQNAPKRERKLPEQQARAQELSSSQAHTSDECATRERLGRPPSRIWSCFICTEKLHEHTFSWGLRLFWSLLALWTSRAPIISISSIAQRGRKPFQIFEGCPLVTKALHPCRFKNWHTFDCNLSG